MQFVQLLSFGTCVLAIIVCAMRLVRSLRPVVEVDLFHATFLLVCTFIIYGAGILFGTIGLFSRWILVLGSVVMIVCLRGTLPAAWNECRLLARDFWGDLSARPALLVPFVVPLLLHMVTPMQNGDSLIYHLSNANYFISTASTSTHQAEMMSDANALWAYYTRGMELIYAFFLQFPGARFSILAFKTIFFLAFYFLLRRTAGSPVVAASFFMLTWSLVLVHNDIGSLKNDLGVAIVSVYAVVLLTESQWRPAYHVPLAIALTLLLAFKGNGLFYAPVLWLVWLYRGRRQVVRIARLTFALIIPLGLYFYWVNLIQKGSPLYPFAVRVFGVQLFPGEPGALQTSILANLDRDFPVFLVRGVIRKMGPIVPGLIGVGLLLALGGTLKAWLRRKQGYVSLLSWAFLAWWLFVYGMTPFSDQSKSIPHSLLYAGQSTRLALPAILLAVLLLSHAISNVHGRWRWCRGFWFPGIIVVSIINLVWFDVLALVVKPESAFIAQAAALRTFDNRILLAFTVIIWGLASLGAYKGRRYVLILLGLACVLLYCFGYPYSLAYTRGFKRVGQTTGVFRFLDEHDLREYRVTLHSGGDSQFLKFINGYLLGNAARVTVSRDVSSAESSDLLLVCANDQWDSGYMVSGMKYGRSLSYWDSNDVPADFQLVYGDSFYLAYINTNTVTDSIRWIPRVSSGG